MIEDGLIYVHPFAADAATDVTQAGGKGATLARLFQAGLPIPPGCIVTTQALTMFLDRQGGRQVDAVEDARQALSEAEPPAALQEALDTVLYEFGPSPSGWAVRSSAVSEDSTIASFAGVYESFLGIQAVDLWASIQACWASWWSDRAIAYREHLGDTTPLPDMAVVIQTMVPAHCAGVAFTAEPMQGDHTRMVINAAPGLGVTVVSGVVAPEQYILAKEPHIRVLEARLLRPDRSSLLPSEVVINLGELLCRIENLCGRPQDVEWAWDGTQIWIVQSRPITTLAGEARPDTQTVWSNGNLKDVMPGLVSSFTWSLMRPQLEGAMRQQYAQAGYTVPTETPIIRRFWGRPYFNLSLFQEAAYRLYGSTPEKQVAGMGGTTIQGFTPSQPPSLWQRLGWLCNGLRFGRIAERARKTAISSFAAVQRQWAEELRQIPQLDREALLDKFESFTSITRPFLLQHLHLTWAMSGNFSYLSESIERLIPQASTGLVADLVTGIGEVSSADHSYRLWELSRLAVQSPQIMSFLQRQEWSTWPEVFADTAFGRAWQEFLNTFGHRSLYEVEMANPRWREQPDYLFEVLASYATLDREEAPFAPQEQFRRRQAAECEMRRGLAFWRRPWLHTVVRRTQEFSRLRENSKSHLVQLIDIGRCMALSAARFLVCDGTLTDPETIFLLEIDEVKATLQGEKNSQAIRRLINQRRLERQRYAALEAPEAFVGERPMYEQNLAGQGTLLHGLPSSPGRVTGTARILRTPQESARLQPGEILVAPSTDPGWTPLFLLAAGLVMETGGYLSHGAIVAREYGIPAVLNVTSATHRIVDGSTITLDGGAGTVRLSGAAAADSQSTTR